MDNLLIIESDEVQGEIFTLALSDHFAVEQVNNFADAVTKLRAKAYQMIITEWRINSQTAVQLKPFTKKNDPKHLPIVMVVSDDNSEATMKLAYDSGVSYFITKPYNILQFSETVLGLQNFISVVREVTEAKSRGADTAKTALNQAAIYGTGMELVANISSATEPRDIARKVLRSLRLNGVIAAMQFRNGDDTEQYDYNAEPCDQTTTKVFNVLKDHGRIYQFGRRIMFNDNAISLLVFQVAQNDPKLYDDILDMGAKLVPAIDTQYQKMLQQHIEVTP